MAARKKFALTVLTIQISFIVLFAFFVDYGPQMQAIQDNSTEYETSPVNGNEFHALYPMFQDINIMIFVGVGFLYTFLKKYGYMGVGMTMLMAAIAVQWSMLTHNWLTSTNGIIRIDVKSLIAAEFAAASVVISMGAIFGKTNPLQMVAFTIIETFLYTSNEYLCSKYMQVSDIGGSVSLHLFAATFGLAVAYVLDKNTNVQNNINNEPSYSSNLSCILGTALLWCFWPSFNSALSVGDAQYRAVTNTFLAFLSSMLAAFAVSSLLDKNSKISMSHIQNATLAGGVAIGATCDLMIQPYGALLIGMLGGSLCVIGFKYFGPFLERRNIFDACGVHSLHALPGALAGITGIIAAFIATEANYGHSLYTFYPAMKFADNSTVSGEFSTFYFMGRTPAFQAGCQFLYILENIIIAVITGLFTGLVLRIKWFERLDEKQLYLDEVFWNVPEIENLPDSIKSQSNDKNC